MASSLFTAAQLLLLISFSSAQNRGDSIFGCNPNDGFGQYCPTTCGVARYMTNYQSDMSSELTWMEKQLDDIANLTQQSDEAVENMKQSTDIKVKSSNQDQDYQNVINMLQDVLRYEKTIITQEQQIHDLQNLFDTNSQKMADLRQFSIQMQQQKKCTEPCKDMVEIYPTTGVDCQDIANKGATESGLYYVKTQQSTEPFLVYCEIDNFRRGFTVIQRRRDGSVDFKKDWVQYKEGFGYLSPDDTTEFWLGNEKIHQLTTSSTLPIVLRIEMVDWEGNKRYADYNMFKVGPEADMYRMTYGFYLAGDAGDAFDGFDFGDDPSDKFLTAHNGMYFSTYDRDNDKYDGNCAEQDGSGWWMNRCHAAHLNGKYYQGGTYTAKDAGDSGFDNGIIWATWHDRWYSLKETTMKLIPVNRLPTGTQQSGVKNLGGLGI